MSPPTFDQIVLPNLDAAHNLARWLTGDPNHAQDVVQEAALRALRHFTTYRGGDGRSWFLRIVRNTAMTSLASSARQRTVSLETTTADGQTEPIAIPDQAADPEQAFANIEAADALDRALAALPVDLRECVILRELEECSYRDIAEISGVPIGTVMSRLWRARQILARTIDKAARP